jgi:hypothetical protein
MTKLSPAAIAVDDALATCIQLQGEIVRARPLAAAALRAAADQVVPAPCLPYDSCCDVYAAAIRAELLAIAIELEV